MRQAFSTYIIKNRAKKAMQGRFFKALAAALLPMLVVSAVTMLIVALVPDAKETLELAVRGKFETREARLLYYNSVMDICTNCISMLSAVFAFLFVGAQRLFLDMLRGREVKLKNLFRYFGRWYVAFVYPAVTVAVTTGIRKILDMLTASGMSAEAVTVMAWVVQLLIYYVALKLMFVELVLADNNCTGLVNALKTSWKLVNVNTIVNIIVLYLSFTGWFVVSVITGGLGLLYLLPYMSLAIAAYYEDCKKQNQ